ncbi:MAG TPA: hypothetical protein VF171_06085 [Trueperaceae bacterium]
MLAYDARPVSDAALRLGIPQVLDRICVRPPYFALTDLTLEGCSFAATAMAEAPAFLERGPMTAAEVGRHAAIAGLCHAALSQADHKRRYYLAQRAECRYTPNAAPYGTPVRLQTEVRSLTKRQAQVAVRATAAGQDFATLDIDYTILTEPTFERLFAHRARPARLATNPYRQLLQTDYQQSGEQAEQVIAHVPAAACSGHFDDYPALPVAVLMGQLSYLAGQIIADKPRPFRVLKGLVDASDLCWSGESARFRVVRTTTQARVRAFDCEAYAGERKVGSMKLWAELVH